MKKDSRLSNNEIVVATVAVIISFAALILSLWEGRERRLHDRLSVMPRLTFSTQVALGTPPIGVFVSNKGAGPAIVRSFTILVDGKAMAQDDFGGWQQAVGRLNIGGQWASFHSLEVGDALIVGDTSFLLEEDGPPDLQHEIRIKTAIERLSVQIVYESVYGDVRTSTLKWSGNIYEDGAPR